MNKRLTHIQQLVADRRAKVAKKPLKPVEAHKKVAEAPKPIDAPIAPEAPVVETPLPPTADVPASAYGLPDTATLYGASVIPETTEAPVDETPVAEEAPIVEDAPIEEAVPEVPADETPVETDGAEGFSKKGKKGKKRKNSED